LQETGADSVVSVVELPKTQSPELLTVIDPRGRLWPWFPSEEWSGVLTRRQDAVTAYKRDGTVYAFWRKTVEQHGSLYGRDVRPLIIPPEDSCELDSEADWQALVQRWEARHGGA